MAAHLEQAFNVYFYTGRTPIVAIYAAWTDVRLN